MKFLPNASKIKMIRIFPLEVDNIEPYVVNWVDQDNQFVEGKEAQLQKVLETKGDNPKLTNLVKKLKIFFMINIC